MLKINDNHERTYQWLYDDIQQRNDQIINSRDMLWKPISFDYTLFHIIYNMLWISCTICANNMYLIILLNRLWVMNKSITFCDLFWHRTFTLNILCKQKRYGWIIYGKCHMKSVKDVYSRYRSMDPYKIKWLFSHEEYPVHPDCNDHNISVRNNNANYVQSVCVYFVDCFLWSFRTQRVTYPESDPCTEFWFKPRHFNEVSNSYLGPDIWKGWHRYCTRNSHIILEIECNLKAWNKKLNHQTTDTTLWKVEHKSCSRGRIHRIGTKRNIWMVKNFWFNICNYLSFKTLIYGQWNVSQRLKGWINGNPSVQLKYQYPQLIKVIFELQTSRWSTYCWWGERY